MTEAFNCKKCGAVGIHKRFVDTYCSTCIYDTLRGSEFIDHSEFPAYVYGLYDEEDYLVYIGVTGDPYTRCHSHMVEKTFSYMKVLQRFGSRATADRYEKFAINRFKPPLNRLIDTNYIADNDWYPTLKVFGSVRPRKKKRVPRQSKNSNVKKAEQPKQRAQKPEQRQSVFCSICKKPVGHYNRAPVGDGSYAHSKCKEGGTMRMQYGANKTCLICNKKIKNRTNMVEIKDSAGRSGTLHLTCYRARVAFIDSREKK